MATSHGQRAYAVVFESDGQWSRGLRRFLPPEISVVERPPLRDLAAPPTSPLASLLVVDDEDDAASVLAWTERQRRENPAGLRLGVVRPADQELAWCLREAGMAMIWDEFWQLPSMARMIARFWRELPPPDLSLEPRIWNNLPWPPDDWP